MAKTISDYKKDYDKAYKARDYNGMRAANDGANEIRRNSGQAEYSSAVGDAQRASNSNRDTTISGGSGGNAGGGNNSYYDSDIQSKIEALNEAKRQSTIDGLTKARDNALASLDERKSALEPYYYNKKNQAAAQNDISTMNFAQYMASRGVGGSAAAMPEIYRNANLQNQIGALDQQQASDLSAIEKDRSNIQTNYQTDLSAAMADAEATKLQNYINQMNADRAYNTEKEATAKTDYANTIGAYSNDYQAEINKIDALIKAGQVYDTDGVKLQYKKDLLSTARSGKMANQKTAEAEAEQQAFNNWIKQQQLYNQTRQTDYTVNKPYYNPNSGSGGSSTTRFNGFTKSEALSAFNNGIGTQPVMEALKYFYNYEE